MAQMDGTQLVEDLIGKPARVTPEKSIAFYRQPDDSQWHAIDCRTLRELVMDMQAFLQSAGMRSGDVAGIALPSSVTWEVIRFACLNIGATVVGLDHHDLGDNFTHVVGISSVDHLITDDKAHQQLDPSTHPGIHTRIVIDPTTPTKPVENRAQVYRYNGHPDSRDAVSAPPANPDDDVATIVFSSGTSDRPKGIVYTAAQIGLAITAILGTFPELDDTRRTACWLPLSNLFQQIVNLCAFKVGAPIYFVEDPRQITQLLPQIKPIVLVGVPRFFDKAHQSIRSRLRSLPWPLPLIAGFLLRHAGSQTATQRFWAIIAKPVFAPVRQAFGGQLAFFISGSAALPPHLLQQFDALGLPIYEAYGLSENIIPISVNRPGAHRFGSVGKPLEQNELKIAEDSELWCRGPGICRQYAGSDEPPARDPDGFLATGDFADIDADGFLWLKGRKADTFKTSTGRLISPMEVEAPMLAIDGVDQVLVFGENRPFLVALITMRAPCPDEDAMLSLIDQLSHAVSVLADYKQPAGVILSRRPFSMSDGELTANLKLRRKAIAARYASHIDALYAAIQHHRLRQDSLEHHDRLNDFALL